MTENQGNPYNETYYKYYCGDGGYERSEHWMQFFGSIAERIIADFAPQSVLDAGCAIGMLVEAFLKRGVDAYGFDISDYAIAQMPAVYASSVKVGSLLDPNVVERHFDVVVCIEVLEHLQPNEADQAIRNLCSWGDVIIFTSSPDDYSEVTHFNVRQPGYWAEKFAQNGFARVVEYDAAYIAPWAQVYRRDTVILTAVAGQYENALWQKTKEIHALRQLVNKQQFIEREARRDVEWYKNEFERLVSEIQGLHGQMQVEQQKSLEVADFERQIANLQQDYQLMRAIALHHEQHAAQAEQTISSIQSTRAGRMLMMWWTLKQRASVSQRRLARVRQLARTARITLRNKGVIGLSGRTIRWLLGERRYYRKDFASIPISQSQAPTLHAASHANPLTDYATWINENEPDSDALERQRSDASKLGYQPLISILVPVYNTHLEMLSAMIESVLDQTYGHWELCIVDGASPNAVVWDLLTTYGQQDSRIKLKRLEKNLGIAGNSNAALELVEGEFVALLDHDDTLAPFALYEVAKLLNTQSELDFIYSDKDTMHQDGTRFSPLFKPQWSPEILFNANYLTHLCILRTSLVRKIGGFNSQTDGAQDWALFLAAAYHSNRFAHISKVLYHWREHSQSTASGLQAKPYAAKGQLQAIQWYLEVRKLNAVVRFEDESVARIIWNTDTSLKITVILDLEQHLDAKQLNALVRSYVLDSPYPSTELIILNRSNNMDELEKAFLVTTNESVRLLTPDPGTTPGAARNQAATIATGDVLLFVSSRLKPVDNNIFAELVGWTQHPDVGVVGGQLLQPDGTIAHIGYVLNLGGIVGSFGAGLQLYSGTLMGHMIWYRNFSAISGDCIAMRREQFEAVNGFDEAYTRHGYDVDLCLRLLTLGSRHVYTPFATLQYAENVPSTWTANNQDSIRLTSQHNDYFKEVDHYYNPNLSLDQIVPHMKVSRKMPVSQEATPKAQPGTWDVYSTEASILTSIYDFSMEHINASRSIVENHKGDLDIRSITWFLPDFSNAFYGGIYTILRFATDFETRHQVKDRFVIFSSSSEKVLKSRIVAAFPALAAAPITVLDHIDDASQLPPTDVGICTLWTTAFALLRFNQTKRKFYFIQDMEALFYPAGSLSGLVESSYRFGFYGLVNTPGLSEIYKRDYNGEAKAFIPAVNTKVFYPPHALQSNKSPYRVFFYGRPGHPRNAFELGTGALRELKQKMGEAVEIVSAGADWNPADYGLTGIVENLGLLKYEETGELYRTCHAGLIMMFTRHPSYLPMELMACNSLVVTNFNPYTSWLLVQEQNCLLTELSVTAIAQTLERGLKDTALRERITRTAQHMVLSQHTAWEPEIDAILQYMRNPDV